VSGFPVPFALVRKTREFPSRLWAIQEDFAFDSDVAACRIVVPKGFVTDACSIPRVPLLYLAAGGTADEAGYVHDFLYTTQRFAREKCDQVLREAIVAMGYSKELAGSFYEAVRLFGGSHWNLPNQTQPDHVQALIPPQLEAA
jgi:hypothetical protein